MRKYLLTPGPVELPESVSAAAGRPLVSHRCTEFSELFKGIETKLGELFQSEEPVVILPSSGTGALECAAVNFLRPNAKFISLSCGAFGERFREIALKTGAHGIFADYAAGEAPSPESAAKLVAENPDAEALLITHNETSAGVTVPLREILAALPDKRPLVIVDGVSSVGAIEILPEAWGADVVCTASQKGLMTPPGLGLLWLSKRAQAALSDASPASYYFDLKLHLKNMTPKNFANPYTPPVSLYFALDEALNIILKDGASNWFARRRAWADGFASALETLGFNLFVKNAALRSAGLTAFTPKNGEPEAVRSRLSAMGFETAGGQGSMKGKLIRVAHYTDWDFSDMKNILGAFAAASGSDERLAAAESAAEKIYFGKDGSR